MALFDLLSFQRLEKTQVRRWRSCSAEPGILGSTTKTRSEAMVLGTPNADTASRAEGLHSAAFGFFLLFLLEN